jgi:fatty acid desaturase
MSYIHTNHFLSPLTGELDDPLINSLSLKNPKLVDMIFSNFSHHVEHHLFPSMSTVHYPKVRKLLLKLYPERFQLLPMMDAIKLLFKTPRIYEKYVYLVTTDGKQRLSCLMPKR